MKRRIRLFSRFERLWHWSQAFLIIGMLITGFELHGTYTLLGYRTAAEVHVACAVALMTVWVFAIFWHIITGEWRQYIPTTRKLNAIIYFYTRGIFRGDPHPFRPTRGRKHNPLQLLAYLVFNTVVSPTIWITGLLYLSIQLADSMIPIPLSVVAPIHVAAAYATATFLLAHVYMITTGRSVFQHLKAMITGFKTVEVDPEPVADALPERTLGTGR
ncbi:MAG TPA: cytochrome b/b6 domain-containing protein [Myxococcales bacterium LLY-WYZ-16_1]|nr:cytochrome b/b6 domain-containing protein [Myxococcales bacterium LLY-WYZ-16_1]